MIEPNPVTYRMLHEDAAGMGLCPEFFMVSGIDADAVVACNCEFNDGHEAHCDIVAAYKLRETVHEKHAKNLGNQRYTL